MEMCLILMYNTTIKLYRRDSQRIGKSESAALDWDLWPVPCWHSCRQITGSSCRLCLPRASFIKWHVCHTFIFIRSAENQRWETVRGSGGWELLPLSHSLFVPAIAWGPITFSSDRSPPPLLSTALPRSPELQLQQHLPLNMQSACQGIKETYIHTNVVAGVKLIFTDIRSVRTYSPFIWSWRKRPEHCQLMLNPTRTAILILMSKTSEPSCPLTAVLYYQKPRS